MPTPSNNRPTTADKRRWLVLALLCASQFMVVLDFSIVNVALPAMQHDLGFSQQNLQWVISAYALTFGGFLLLGGRAADLFGRRRVFMAGLGLFVLASLVGGLAQFQWVLISARAFQGLGAAIVSPAALSILTTTFTEGQERNRALGIWEAIAAGGFAAGVLLGGILTDKLSWRWVMFVNVPIGIAAVALSPVFLRERLLGTADWNGFSTSCISGDGCCSPGFSTLKSHRCEVHNGERYSGVDGGAVALNSYPRLWQFCPRSAAGNGDRWVWHRDCSGFSDGRCYCWSCRQ